MSTTAALAPRRADGRVRQGDPFPPTGDGPRAPWWSPAATEQRTHAAWSRDPCRACPSAPAPYAGGRLTRLGGRDTDMEGPTSSGFLRVAELGPRICVSEFLRAPARG